MIKSLFLIGEDGIIFFNMIVITIFVQNYCTSFNANDRNQTVDDTALKKGAPMVSSPYRLGLLHLLDTIEESSVEFFSFQTVCQSKRHQIRYRPQLDKR